MFVCIVGDLMSKYLGVDPSLAQSASHLGIFRGFFGETLPEPQKKIIRLAAGEAPGVLKTFGWRAGALQRDRLRAEAQLWQGVGRCWVVTEGGKCPYHEGNSSLGSFSPAC